MTPMADTAPSVAADGVCRRCGHLPRAAFVETCSVCGGSMRPPALADDDAEAEFVRAEGAAPTRRRALAFASAAGAVLGTATLAFDALLGGPWSSAILGISAAALGASAGRLWSRGLADHSVRRQPYERRDHRIEESITALAMHSAAASHAMSDALMQLRRAMEEFAAARGGDATSARNADAASAAPVKRRTHRRKATA